MRAPCLRSLMIILFSHETNQQCYELKNGVTPRPVELHIVRQPDRSPDAIGARELLRNFGFGPNAARQTVRWDYAGVVMIQELISPPADCLAGLLHQAGIGL